MDGATTTDARRPEDGVERDPFAPVTFDASEHGGLDEGAKPPFEDSDELEASSFADDLVDDLLPDEFDWRRVVRRYPLPALLVAAVGGFLLGRSRGEALIGALGDAAGDHVSARLASLAEDEERF